LLRPLVEQWCKKGRDPNSDFPIYYYVSLRKSEFGSLRFAFIISFAFIFPLVDRRAKLGLTENGERR